MSNNQSEDNYQDYSGECDRAITSESVFGGSDSPIYCGVLSYMRRNYSRNISHPDVDVVVSGVPFDMATSGRSGTRFGPQGVRAASANLGWENQRWPWPFAVFDHLGVIDFGDVYFNYGEPKDLVEKLEAHTDKILAANKKMLTFGGDHYIALPLIRAHARKYGPVSLIHFDAHTDTYSAGTEYDHGTMFYHGVKEGIIDPSRSIQIGIRTTYDTENYPFQVLDGAWVNDHGPAAVLEQIKKRVGNHPTYITFDIDGLDPAFAPGTGTPVCGGLTTDCALKIIRGMVDLNLIGMDVVEVAPPFDHADITSLAGATIGLEYLCVLAAQKLKAQGKLK